MRRAPWLALALLLRLVAPSHADAQSAPPELAIVSTGPTGEIASLSDASEIRIVFSEPMVALGRIPARVTAPFVKISPAITGTFRWSGTTILIFTPDPARRLPLATTYTISIAASATAVSGRRLARPESFTFTTPTVKLLRTEWYRRGGRFDAPVVVLLRFNQPVVPRDIAAHLSAALQPHEWQPPAFTEAEQARLRRLHPQALGQLNAKVQRTAAVAAATSPVTLRVASDWDKTRFPPARDLVVLETASVVEPESWVNLTLDTRVPSPAGRATPAEPKSFSMHVERAFFADGFTFCRAECDPDFANPIELRTEVQTPTFASALEVTDITNPQAERRVDKPAPGVPSAAAALGAPPAAGARDRTNDVASAFSFEDAGYAPQPPVRTYAAVLDPALTAADGQTLGYTWLGIVENWHRPAFTSFGDGHGVWEEGGGTQLPFYGLNLRDVTQWAVAVQPGQLMARLLGLQKNGFREAPAGSGTPRRLGGAPDQILSHGLDISNALRSNGRGLLWAAVRDGEPIPQSKRRVTPSDGALPVRSTLVQVTNLGISVKDSPQNTLVFVTRLGTGEPVAGAAVSIVLPDSRTAWRGTTNASGLAVAPDTPFRDPERFWDRQVEFLVMAEKDGDVAYVGSDWNEGIEPWSFGTSLDLRQRDPLLRGTVFTDRGVYRLGEEVHFKGVLRSNTPAGVRMLQAGTPVWISVRDARDRMIDERTVRVNAWSSAEWALTLPDDGALGSYSVRAILESDRPRPAPADARNPAITPSPDAEDWKVYDKTVWSSFLVAAYRRPDFRVDITLSADKPIAGSSLKGTIAGRYLFGAAMGGRPVEWSYSRRRAYDAPKTILDRFGADRWAFVGWEDDEDAREEPGDLRRDHGTLARSGDLPLTLETKGGDGLPYVYTLEGDVEEVSRQHIANRGELTVHPAPWYVGIRRPPYFTQQREGLTTEIVAVGLTGEAVAGVPVDITLTQIQWNSVRRAEGDGFYTWDTERKAIEAGRWTVTTAAEPVPLAIPIPAGGYYILKATGRGEGVAAVTTSSFYALGEGYTAWARFDHNRIELVPEKKTYKPGDTARVMIQSPWEQATALVTTEREGIRSYRTFTLASTQESISIPITEADIPNVFVSVLLVKGRTGQAVAAEATGIDASDPGKPAFRLGYVELDVEDASKRLAVSVAANQKEYRPANHARIDVNVKDAAGRGAAAEVTLWAVDYGVLSLTDYKTPDVLGSVYVRKALQVMNEDNRQRIISRRVLTPKGETEGGGGGDGRDTRRDFRVLAFWLGSVTTDAEGRAGVDVTLPQSLTTYRIMAVAADRASRFGGGDAEIRINKPVTLKPAFPRFLALGDHATFGAVVTSQLASAGSAIVTMKSLDPALLEVLPESTRTVSIGAGGSIEVRFDAVARAVGRARMQITVAVGAEQDAFEDEVPVELLVSPETVAAYGTATAEAPRAAEAVTLPAGVVPGIGGLRVELASTALVGLSEGATYLVEYPYGCAEQRGSRALALILSADLGDAFSLPGISTGTQARERSEASPPERSGAPGAPASDGVGGSAGAQAPRIKEAAQRALTDLRLFQCSSGGFAYWAGDCSSVSPYLTSYLLHVLHVASTLGYSVDREMTSRARSYLTEAMAQPPPENESWWPAYTAWQAFAIKALVEDGVNQDSNLTRVYGYRDRMPVFGLAYLLDALVAKGEANGPRAGDLRRRIGNAILPEAGQSHVEELSDPYLLWFWNSNVRSTGIVLASLVRSGASPALLQPVVRWMMQARKDGRWGNTQENAVAMEALVAYYRAHESSAPNFRASVTLGGNEIVSRPFAGRSTTSAVTNVPLARLLETSPEVRLKPDTTTVTPSQSSVAVVGSGFSRTGQSLPLTFAREGDGTLFYSTRLTYAADTPFPEGLDAGFRIERTYEPYVETGSRPPARSFKAGDLVRVTLTLSLTKERRFVAVEDPLPAGFEPVESWFASTTRDLARDQNREGRGEQAEGSRWEEWWRRGGFDHVERHDDRVRLFAMRLGEGRHQFSYIARATTSGVFRTAPAHVEEMYSPEIFGRTETAVVEVKR